MRTYRANFTATDRNGVAHTVRREAARVNMEPRVDARYSVRLGKGMFRDYVFINQVVPGPRGPRVSKTVVTLDWHAAITIVDLLVQVAYEEAPLG